MRRGRHADEGGENIDKHAQVPATFHVIACFPVGSGRKKVAKHVFHVFGLLD